MNVNEKLNSKNVAELRKLAACYGIAGRSTMKKAELIDKLIDAGVETRLAIDEITPEQQAAYAEQYNATQAKRADDNHAAAVAQIRANIDAEEEKKAAARRARNRTDYAPAPVPEPTVNEVAILRDAPGRAIVTAAFDGQSVGGSIVRKGKRLVLTAGKVTVTGNSFEKVAKRLAKALGFHAERIDVARSF